MGAIAGITTVLNDYWEKEKTNFPYPSMVGSGDRVSICWAIFGEVPDLSLSLVSLDSENKVSPDIENKVPKLFHACQGLNLKDPTDKREAPVEVFHSCRGSNKCKAQGGCGFAQLDTGGGSCRSVTLREGGVLPGESGNDYSSPADNRCKGFGGCAVPISASQLFPKSGTMTLYKFDNDNNPQKLPEKITFEKGDNVYAKAWEAYCKVRKVNENPPEASDLRVAFPPST